MNPCRELSLMVTVKSGPGIIAPDKAIIKDETKMVRRAVNIRFAWFYFLPIFLAICFALLNCDVWITASLTGLAAASSRI